MNDSPQLEVKRTDLFRQLVTVGDSGEVDHDHFRQVRQAGLSLCQTR